jgi:hypothetical protein
MIIHCGVAAVIEGDSAMTYSRKARVIVAGSISGQLLTLIKNTRTV